MPGLGGPVQVVNSVRNTQSPDNAASNARMAADQAAARAQSESQFQRSQGLSRERFDWEKSKEAEKKADATPDSKVAEKTGSEEFPKV